MKAINRNKTVLNFNGTVLHPANDITVESQFSLKANGYKPWLYKPKFDVCRFLKKPYNPIVILAYNLLKNFTNFNHTCPYVVSLILYSFNNIISHLIIVSCRARKLLMGFIYFMTLCPFLGRLVNFYWKSIGYSKSVFSFLQMYILLL